MKFNFKWPWGAKNSVALLNEAMVRDVYGGGLSKVGLSVNSKTVLRVSACYACVRNISEDLAKLNLHLYRRKSRGKERAVDHSLYAVLVAKPNGWQTPFEFVQLLTAFMLLRGNGYALIVRGYGGRVIELLPLHPDRVEVKQGLDLTLSYVYTASNGARKTYQQPDILHLRGFTLNGWMGVTPLEYARDSFGLAMAAEEHGARMFGGRVTGPGVLKTPNKLSDPAYKRLRESWEENADGLENAAKPLILEENLSWESLGLKLTDLQFLETRRFQVEEIARLFRMPLHKIGQLDRATFSNIEHQSQEYVTDTLLPWARRWEQSAARDLLSDKDRPLYYMAFMFNSLLRGDMKARGEFYGKLFSVAALSPNDIREMEDLDSYEEGDGYFVPANYLPIAQSGQQKGVANGT
ncbi:phage portal protein [Deefgea rivuli]|uniref:phage portal protein n=1 Tax=Deefgea rivuli TaxID=400948 RepID=UPI000688EF26|nr:phage portal protein [Deefgea rivuli]